ncbi:cyclase family protein [Rhodococcus aetherivorans]|uniref:cyclase family protein n=1 Tax=Rhodococcus aetherivorans TaxID=191292 RepID=UPI00045CD3A5|nr:cyclase family protein [Rhodococcus aetherivorans]KDE11062.1 cyclase [Rhodococcus aetherivorans]
MRVRRIVDLSRTVSGDTQVYPGDPVPVLTPHATLERDGYNLLRVEIGSQTGTHVDAPLHMRAGAAPIDRVPLEHFVGRGIVLDVRGLPPRTAVTRRHVVDGVAGGPDPGPGDIVLLHTGWAEHYGTDAYFEHPYLSEDACRWLLGRGVRTIGLDAPSIDSALGSDYPAHRLVAKAGGIVCENLRNLELVDFPDPLISLLPLRLRDADGAPVRAVAIALEP